MCRFRLFVMFYVSPVQYRRGLDNKGDFCISVSVSVSMGRNVCLAFYALHPAGHCSVISTRVDVLNELVVFPACKQSSPNLYPVVAAGW